MMAHIGIGIVIGLLMAASIMVAVDKYYTEQEENLKAEIEKTAPPRKTFETLKKERDERKAKEKQAEIAASVGEFSIDDILAEFATKEKANVTSVELDDIIADCK